MGPQPTRALLLIGLFAACAAKYPRGGFAVKQDETDAERRCRSGSSADCGTLGRALLAKEGTEKDFERALVLLEIACGQDDLPSCAALAGAYRRGSRSEQSLARARQLAAHACERGSAAGCTQLGEVIGQQEGDEEARRAAFSKACDLGDAEGCERYGLAQSRRVMGNRDAGDAALARACEMGRLSSCHFLAGSRLAQPEARDDALALLVRTCGRGFTASCGYLAMMVAPLLAANADCAGAVRVAESACRANDKNACAVLDACKLAEPREAGPARERLGASCGKNVALACLYWADAESARGKTGDEIRDAYELACEGGGRIAEVACPRFDAARLAVARTASDAETALSALRRECDDSSGEACCELGEQYRIGKWMPADTGKAGELRSKACTLGCQRCCR